MKLLSRPDFFKGSPYYLLVMDLLQLVLKMATIS